MSRARSSGDATADRRFDHAMGYREAGEHEAAADLIEQALDLAPGWAAGWVALGEAREAAGDPARAIAAYRAALERDAADIAGAGVRLARLGARPADGALAPAHVEALFDDYAPRFETALVQRLAYRGPALLRAALEALPARRFAHALDLGCGTGLAAEALAALCDRIDGVDLSGAMLEKARTKALYTELSQGEITAHLQAMPPGSIDLAVAADVLVYVGDLARLFAAVARALRPGGLFLFTVQDAGRDAMRLGPDLRYAHGEAKIRDWAGAAGFRPVSIVAASTRHDAGHPVPGLVVLLENLAPIAG